MRDDEGTVFDSDARRSATLVEDDHSDGSEDFTETAVGTPFAGNARARKIHDILMTTYRRFWREFYEMEPNYCLHVIAELTPRPDETCSHSYDYCLEDDWDGMDVDTSDDSDDLVFEELSKWEACTPLSFNVFENRRAVALACPFIKYGGDPSFDERAYLKLFHSSGWQDTLGGPEKNQWRDPDYRRIIACTARELMSEPKHYGEGDPISIYCDDIDEQGILPLKISDILYDMRYNDSDKLGWLGISLDAKSFFELDLPWRDPARNKSRPSVESRLDKFCWEPTCIQFVCFQFNYHTCWSTKYPVETSRSNSALKKHHIEKGKKSCGPQCFLEYDGDYDEDMEYDDLTLLDTALAISPDRPCDVSAVVRIPCYKVFARRVEKVNVSKPPARVRPGFWQPGEVHLRPRNELTNIDLPCRHHGPCTARSKCPCYVGGYHCRRTCMCGDECALRYQGCSHNGPCPCDRNSKRAWKDVCACARNNWECTEACHKTKDKRMAGRVILCRNMTTQEKNPVEVIVKGSQWGFGAFAPTAIRKGQYIGDYLGEIFSGKEGDHHAMLFKFSKYNYTFKLDDALEYYADALGAGNNTRYFNHTMRSNVEPDLTTINGDGKMAFFAAQNIKRGQEMVFDYGEQYWQDVAS